MDNFDREMHKATCDKCKKECEVPFKPTEGKPVLCKECYMASRPKRDNFGGGNRNFDRGPREMHKATCAKCKQECEVPFKPTEGKPVFCRECFAKEREDQVGKFD